MSATIRTSGLPANFKPKPQTQAVADAVQAKFGLTSFGTYAGHEPTADLGLDIFVTKEQGDRVAAWLVENIEALGIDYVIWWQRIYNPEIKKAWRDMADRGGITQNHKDHVHVSLEATAQGNQPPQGDDDLNADQNAALGRIDQRAANIEAAVSRIDRDTDDDLFRKRVQEEVVGVLRAPEFNIAARLAAIEKKLDQGGGNGPSAAAIADEIAKRLAE